MHKASVHIGTCGWKHPHWKGPFYDKNLSINKWLDFYSTRFHTVELTTAFYKLPREWTLDEWRERTPEHFRFAIKAGPSVTNIQKLIDPRHAIDTFIERVRFLGKKAGPILFELPSEWDFDLQRLDDFLVALPSDFKYVFEFRDNSWWNEKVFDILKQYNVAFCLFDLAGVNSPKMTTADFIYVRLHGPEEAYNGQYDIKSLRDWASLFSEWRAEGKEIYCYFNNDMNGYAALDALRMKDVIKQS
jgi:uncharacterized protein YecE (DUF72 family)